MMLRLIYCYLLHHLLLDTASAIRGQKVVKATVGEFPFVVSLQRYPGGNHFCTGTLISRKHVITASHCVADTTPGKVRVALGKPDLRCVTRKYAVHWWIHHDSWINLKGRTHYGVFWRDLTIISLRASNINIQPAVISPLNVQQVRGKKGIVAGWGITNTGKVANILRKATVNILRDDEMRRQMFLTTNQLYPSTSKLLFTAAEPFVAVGCGDSGAPLLSAQDHSLLGITAGVCPNSSMTWADLPQYILDKHRVNVHTSVDYYKDFINDVIG